MKHPTTVILITGYPAAGKTTLARYLARELGLPLLCKDDMKEVLFATLGWSPPEWARKLGVAAFTLLYQQVEMLLAAHVDHIVEANFDPFYADAFWQRLAANYDLRTLQLRCECEPAVLVARDRARVQDGTRHPGHLPIEDLAYFDWMQKGPVGWINIAGERISVDTVALAVDQYGAVVERVRAFMVAGR